jgi:hypothetical protein
MDKQTYKVMVSEALSELSLIEKMVKETPNNMELGKKIRQHFTSDK